MLKKKISNFSVKNHHFNHLLKSFRAIAGIYTEQTMRFLFLLVIRFGCTNRNASFNSVMFCKSVDNLGVLRCIVWSPLYRPQYFSLAFYKLHPIISSSWFLVVCWKAVCLVSPTHLFFFFYLNTRHCVKFWKESIFINYIVRHFIANKLRNACTRVTAYTLGISARVSWSL